MNTEELTLKEAAKLSRMRAEGLEILAKSMEHTSAYSTGIYSSTTKGKQVKQYLFLVNINGRLDHEAIMKILDVIAEANNLQ